MNKNIVFIGGIHGVGKGTICGKICEQTDFVHITASKILKWNEISELDNKKVENVQSTQDRLIIGLEKTLKENESYLLDGHFCLFNLEGEIEKVPMETFDKIAPKLIAVVTANGNIIKERLEERDNKTYDLDLLMGMQDSEVAYAQQVSENLKVPFIEIKDDNYQSLMEIL